MQELNLKGFDDIFGKDRGKSTVVDLLRYHRVNGVTSPSTPITGHISPDGFELIEDSKVIAKMTWKEFHVQCGKAMMGGFVINKEVMLDISSLQTLVEEAPIWQ